MADKVYLWRSAESVKSAPKLSSFTNVIINVDSDNWFESQGGDDTGRTLEFTCPWGTQQIANDILARIKGYSYQPYSASGAILDMAAELGDAITVEGLYSIIASQDITFGAISTSDVSAPAEEEIEHEYPYLSKADRDIQRKISASASAVLTVTTEKIEAEVRRASAAEGELSGRLTVTAESIEAEVRRASVAEGELSGRLTITAESIEAEVRRASAAEGELSGRLTVAADAITAEVARAKGEEASLYSRISMTESEILAEVSSTYATKASLSSYMTSASISVSTSGISLSYTKSGGGTTTGSTISVREQISLESDKDITIKGDRLTIDSTNFKLSKSGSVTATGSFTTTGEKYTCKLAGNGLHLLYYGSTVGQIGVTTEGNLTFRAPSSGYITIGNGTNIGLYVLYDSECSVLAAGGLKVTGKLVFGNGTYIWYYASGGIHTDNSFHADEHITSNGDYIWLNNSSGKIQSEGDIYARGNMWCSGTKSRVVDTENYGMVSLYAMESATPMFSDLGSGTLDEDGITYIFFDPDFMETVELRHEYQVFLTQTGIGAIQRVEKHEEYFIVYGDPGASFDWIAYCRQRDYESLRLEMPGMEPLSEKDGEVYDEPEEDVEDIEIKKISESAGLP